MQHIQLVGFIHLSEESKARTNFVKNEAHLSRMIEGSIEYKADDFYKNRY